MCTTPGCELESHDGPCIDQPETVAAALAEIIRHAELSRDRSVQTMIGPSGIGTECTRWLLHMLAEDEPQSSIDVVNHWAWVGTAIHDRLERDVKASLFNKDRRFATEVTVTVGQIAGRPVKGHVDLVDTLAGPGVVDWKGCGKSSTQKMKAAIRKTGGIETLAKLDDFAVPGFRGGHPGGKYRAQLQSYGLGVLLTLGIRPAWVMNYFIPRNSTREDAFRSGEVWFWTEPFDPQIAIDALARCNGLADLIAGVGLEAALAMFATEQCTESHCPWCPRQRREPADAVKSTTADPFGLGDMRGTT